jgi:hypothetical protein
LIDLAQWCGWWWPFEGAVILTEKPTSLHRDDRGRLHSLTERAIGYSDGWGVYAVHGLRVPADIIEDRTSITVARIDGEQNAELRRVMVELYGRDRYLKDAGAKLVDDAKDELGYPRRLWRREWSDGRAIQMVEVTNSTDEPDGSRRTFFLGVHPECRPILDDEGMLGEPQALTALNAVASLVGKRGEEYRLQAQT